MFLSVARLCFVLTNSPLHAPTFEVFPRAALPRFGRSLVTEVIL